MTRATKLRLVLLGAVVVALVVAGRSFAFDEWFAAFGSWISGSVPRDMCSTSRLTSWSAC